jgi:hypothetical protein
MSEIGIKIEINESNEKKLEELVYFAYSTINP